MSLRRTKAYSDIRRSSSGSNLISWAHSDGPSHDSSGPAYLKDSVSGPESRLMSFLASPSQSPTQGNGNENNAVSEPETSPAIAPIVEHSVDLGYETTFENTIATAPGNTENNPHETSFQASGQLQNVQIDNVLGQVAPENAQQAPFHGVVNNQAPLGSPFIYNPAPAPDGPGAYQGVLAQDTFAAGRPALPMPPGNTHHGLRTHGGMQ